MTAHEPVRQQRIVAGPVVLGGHAERAGSGAGCTKYSSVNSPCHDVIAMNAAIPAPQPLAS